MVSTPPIPPPPFFPRVRLPDIAAHRGAHSVPPADDPLFCARVKIQQKRAEIEAELRKGFDTPDRDHLREAERERVPLFGRPPPVPKPQAARDKQSPLLPPIGHRNTESAPEARPAQPTHDPGQRPQSWRKPWQPPFQAAEPPPQANPHSHQVHTEKPKEAKPRFTSLKESHEAREQQRRDDRRREDARRHREFEYGQQQKQEEEEWESDIRKRFKQERVNIEVQRQRPNYAAEAEARHVETEAWRAEAEARKAEAAAAEARSQAERVRRRMQQQAAEAKNTTEQAKAEEHFEDFLHTRHRRRHAKRHVNADGPRTTPGAAAFMHRDLDKSASLKKPLGGSRKVTVPKEEVLKQAEAAAMHQLAALHHLPSKKERQKAFKELLRAWHPDKNPQNLEVATAVFQRLQEERSRALGP